MSREVELEAEIERLTQEREQWKSEIEQVADVWEIMWRGQHKEARADWLIDDILAYIKDKDAELDAAERKVEQLREALTKLLARDERNTCQHDETHRGGVLWEVCDSCGAQWADDEGGKPEWKDPSEWTAARAALAETEKGDDNPVDQRRD